ncbi:conserved phage-related hypothetical protein [Candidatus Glomeribacter gigasporarum BEG34]|uniref:Uncharacterized protein n=1 Tax=Candidatus Glomeribacter gigasporarum BEG34 TaxID=1070319 RepID=G2JBT5_9BURK|nr:hypothetical protein [Candidatus Glomeribacter gigasporarum]CCD30240.1 conserved phage-related hypothetical protein [Candidatus Glomeribacter gigasporarum BEG34]
MYQLNETAARASEQRSERIVEPGEYIGILTCAEDITSKRGARGIDCVFETENKHIAYFTLWTFGTEGKELFGYSQLNALMTCLGIKSLTLSKGAVCKWDRGYKRMLDMPADLFKDLMHKRIGVLFDTETYYKPDGTPVVKAVPAHFFQADTGLMASELLDGKVQPQQKEKLIKRLRHRPAKEGSAPPAAASQSDFESLPYDSLNDIPF